MKYLLLPKKHKTHLHQPTVPRRLKPLVDASASVPLNAIIKKFIRGERVPIDLKNLKVIPTPSADYSYQHTSVNDVPEMLDHNKKGFDLADAQKKRDELNDAINTSEATQEKLNVKIQELKKQKDTPPAAAGGSAVMPTTA